MLAGVDLADVLRQAPHRTQARQLQPQPLDVGGEEVTDRGECRHLAARLLAPWCWLCVELTAQLPVRSAACLTSQGCFACQWCREQHAQLQQQQSQQGEQPVSGSAAGLPQAGRAAELAGVACQPYKREHGCCGHAAGPPEDAATADAGGIVGAAGGSAQVRIWDACLCAQFV